MTHEVPAPADQPPIRRPIEADTPTPALDEGFQTQTAAATGEPAADREPVVDEHVDDLPKQGSVDKGGHYEPSAKSSESVTEPVTEVAHAAGTLIVETESAEAGEAPAFGHEASHEEIVPQDEHVDDPPPAATVADEPPASDKDAPKKDQQIPVDSEPDTPANSDRVTSTSRPDNAGSGSGGGKPPETAIGKEGSNEPEALSIDEYSRRASKFIDYTDGRRTALLDPGTGKPFGSQGIPESLQANQELNEGFEFLARNGSRIDMRLLLSRHASDTDLTSVGINLNSEAARLARQGGVLFLENIASSQALRDATQTELTAISNLKGLDLSDYRRQLRQAQEAGNHGFAVGVDMQLAGTGVDIALPDFVMDSQDSAEETLTELHKLHRTAIVAEDVDRDTKRAILLRSAVTSAYVRYRDHFLVGKVGDQLVGRYANPQEDMYGGLLVGYAHRSMDTYLSNLGVARVSYAGTGSAYLAGGPYINALVDSARNSVMRRDDILKGLAAARAAQGNNRR